MSKWLPYIVKTLENLGGEAKYSDIYNEFEKVVSENDDVELGTKIYKGKPVWHGVLRREIQQHSSYSDAYKSTNKDIFFPSKGLGKGVWALYDSNTLKKQTKSTIKNIWIEKTYFQHPKAHSSRNQGSRALGKVIWSPEFGKDGRETYKNMRMVSKGDIVLHFINNEHIIGFSEVSSNKMEIVEGVEGTPWSGDRNCLWKLKSFTELEEPIDVKEFLKDPLRGDVLDHIRNLSEVFYTEKNNMRQGAYLTPVSQEFLAFLNLIYLNQISSDLPFYEDFTENLIITNELDLLDHIEHNKHEIIIKNKHFINDKKKVSLSENHNNLVKDLAKGLKDDLNFKFVEEVKMGQGDIDIVVSHETTLIFLEIKTGEQGYLTSAFPNFNGKKDKWFKYMTEKYNDGEFKGKYNKTVHIYVPNGEIEDIKNMRSRFIDEGTLDINKVKKSTHTITSTDICHPDKLETYFKVGRTIDKEYGKRDFLKDFNISPDLKNKMLIPAFRILRIDNNGTDHEILLFTCSARRFLKFASVSRRTPGDPKSNNIASYQRMLDGNRIKEIAKEFINEGGYFPNNILVKLNQDKIKFKPLQKKIRKSLISDSEMKLINESTEHNSEYGLLEIYDDYHSAWVIDGQHRLFSYLKATDDVLDNVNIAGMVGLSPRDEINYFVNINDKAKPVSKDLIWDLNGEIDSDSIEGIISNICKKIDQKLLRNPRKKVKIGDEFKIKKQLNIPSRRDKGRSFQGLCRTFLNDNRFRNYSKPLDSPLHRTVNRWTYIDSTEKSYKRVINPFFKNKKNSDEIVKSTANGYVAFFKKLNIELINNAKSERDILKELYVSDGMLSVMFRMAQHYFNFHKKDTLANDHFFKNFAQSILNYTEDDLKNMSSSTASEKGKTSVEYNFTLDIMNIEGYNYFRKEKPTRLIADVFDLVESEMDKSFGELIYKVIKQKYGINFVYGHPKYRKGAANLLKNGFMGRNVNDVEDLYKLCGITDMITSVCLKGSASPTETVKLSNINPQIVNDGTPKEIEKALKEADSITISPWKEFFEKIISPRTKSSIGFPDHQRFMNALNILTKYRDDTHGHTKRDIYHPKVRKIVEANYDVMRDLIDNAYEEYNL